MKIRKSSLLYRYSILGIDQSTSPITGGTLFLGFFSNTLGAMILAAMMASGIYVYLKIAAFPIYLASWTIGTGFIDPSSLWQSAISGSIVWAALIWLCHATPKFLKNIEVVE